MKEKKILIAVPCMDQIPARFAQSLATLTKVGQCAIAFQISSLIYHARNDLAKKAVKMDVDYILWLDSDMVFEPDTLERLMKHMEQPGVDMVTGVYFRRVPPFSPVLFDKLDFEKGILKNVSEFSELPKDGLFEVGGCGFGCVLMNMDVIYDVLGKHGNAFAPIGDNGEDVAFCYRARDCGYKIFCDPTIKLGHVGNYVITRDYWESYKGTETG